ncbi:MAG: hypothetical protein ACR2NU_13425 [Aeoliella sp.]
MKAAKLKLVAYALLVGVTTLQSGCAWTSGGFLRASGTPAPVVLQGSPTTEQIISAVNQNTARVQSYVTNTARFTVPGMAGLPILRGNIALERPKRFRLKAGIMGSNEIDLGSNDELLWFWVKRNTPPALYYSRHDQFATSGARQMLPVDPTWIGDALGLVQLNPDAYYDGPFPRADGTLELRSPITTPTGSMTRLVVVDPTRAWVLEQHLYDSAAGSAGGAPVASAVAEDFRYDETSMVSLPRRVTIRVPASDLTLTIDVGQVAVNVPVGNPVQLWSPPALEGFPRVDLGSSSPGTPIDLSAVPAAQVAPPSFPLPIVTPAVAPVSYQNQSAAVVNQLPRGGIALEPRASGR